MAAAPNWTAHERETAIAMRLAGHSCREIAEALGARKANAVAMRLFAWGIKAPAEIVADRRRQGVAKMLASPNYGEKRRQSLAAAYTPERRAKAGEQARKLRIWEMGAHLQTVECKRAAAAKGRASYQRQRLGWCPDHLLADYRRMTRAGRCRISAAEARRMLLDEWAAQLRRTLRQIEAVAAKAIAAEAERMAAERAHRRSFAGQMEAVKAGAGLVRRVQVRRAVSDDRSLIGNSLGML